MPDGYRRILIIDDDPDRLAVCRAVLHVAGCTVGTATTPVLSTELLAPPPAAALVAQHLLDDVLPVASWPLMALTTDPGAHIGDHRAQVWLGIPVAPSSLLRALEDLLAADD